MERFDKIATIILILAAIVAAWEIWEAICLLKEGGML